MSGEKTTGTFLSSKTYKIALFWGNVLYLPMAFCILLFQQGFLSLEIALLLLVAISTCCIFVLLKNPNIRNALKSNIWVWELPLFLFGLCLFAWRLSPWRILLWGYVYGTVILILKYRLALKKETS